MSEERTENATPKRLEEARSRGQVAKSPDLSAAVELLAAFAILQAVSAGLFSRLAGETRTAFETLSPREMSVGDITAAMPGAALWFGITLAPLLFGFAAIALVVGVGQVGLLWAPKAFTPQFSRMNPLSGLKRMVSPDSLEGLLKNIAKVGILAAVAWGVFSGFLERLTGMVGGQPIATMAMIGEMASELGLKVGGAFLVVAALDFMWQRRKLSKSLMMTKQEIKEEQKQQEGNPEIKARIRKLQREMAGRRMMSKVPTATVVVTNPTHFAVALTYDATGNGAPTVVAKGMDLLALEIRRVASAAGVPAVENPPLARALYANVDLDQEIPGELYDAVAQVIAFVMKLGRAA